MGGAGGGRNRDCIFHHITFYFGGSDRAFNIRLQIQSEFTGIAATITLLFRPKPLTDGCRCHTLPAAAWRCLALPLFPK